MSLEALLEYFDPFLSFGHLKSMWTFLSWCNHELIELVAHCSIMLGLMQEVAFAPPFVPL